MTFLPDKYEIPKAPSKYFKFQIGENRFRILTTPIIGWIGWDKSGETPKPIRKREGEKWEINEVDPETIKHFWSFVVWNIKDEQVQILEVTQKTIMNALKQLDKDKDWGSPFDYDINVVAVGEKLEREYTITPKPKSELSANAKEKWEEMKNKINLEKLFEGEDPFGEEEVPDEINSGDLPF